MAKLKPPERLGFRLLPRVQQPAWNCDWYKELGKPMDTEKLVPKSWWIHEGTNRVLYVLAGTWQDKNSNAWMLELWKAGAAQAVVISVAEMEALIGDGFLKRYEK